MNSKRRIDIAYHLVDFDNLASVQAHGLLSAEQLAASADEESVAKVSRWRPDGMRLASGVKLRDQAPMPPRALSRALDGLEPDDWYHLLNSKVFFWLDVERLNRQRVACGSSLQVALVLDARQMLRDHGTRAFVSPFNTGNARRTPAPRNRSSFVPYERWVRDAWAFEKIGDRKPRLSSHQPVELTIDGSVPNAMAYLLDMVKLPFGKRLVASEPRDSRQGRTLTTDGII